MTFRPFPPRPGAGGGGGSYDDTALRARVAAGETTNATQDGTLRDHAGRLLKIEETPPFDDAPLRKDIDDLGSALAAEARDRASGDRALLERAEATDTAAGRLAERVTGLEGRPAPSPYDDSALSGRISDVETGVDALDGRLKTVEGRPVASPYDDAAIRKAVSDETAARSAADTAFDERLGGAETAITAHATRLKAVEDRPVPASYDDTAIRGRLTSAEESVGAVDGRVRTLEGRPEHVPYDDTPLRGRVAALETADTEFDDALDREIDTRAEADRQLGLRIDAVSSAGYDDTALKTRVTALEDRPAPTAFDDAALREADRQLGLRIDGLPAPFDPAPLVAADAELGRRIDALSGSGGNAQIEEIQSDISRLTGLAFNQGITLGEHTDQIAVLRTDVDALEAAPTPAPYDDTVLRGRVADLEARPVPAPFDPAPLVAADTDLARRIGLIEDRPAPRPFDDAALRQADADLNIALGGLRVDLSDIENGFFRKGLRPGQSVQGQPFPASLSTLGDLGLSSAGDLRIYVLDVLDAVLAVHAITARPADRIVDYLSSFPAGLRATRLVTDGNSRINVESDPETYPTGRVAIEYGPVSEMLGLYRGPVAALDDRFDAIENGGGAPYDDGPLTRRVVALEERPVPAAFDPSALQAADRALGERIDALGSGGSCGGVLRLISKRRIRVSGAVDLDTIAPAGTSVVEIEAIGGGASGVSSRHSTGNSPAYAHGGNPGEVARGRLKLEPGLRLDILVGAGGASALAQASTTATGILQNAGSASSISVKKAGAEIGSVVAAGGRTWGTTNGSGTFPSTALTTARPEAREALADRNGALGGLATAGTGSNSFGLAHGQPSVDRPSAGGACVYQATGQTDVANGGNGGSVAYTLRPGSPRLSLVAGGHGAVGHSAATYADATPGLNPLPDEAGTYGSGGGGSRYRNANPFSHASPGAFPGGGGGGAYTRSDMPDQESPAGAGGDGCVDLYFYGVAA